MTVGLVTRLVTSGILSKEEVESGLYELVVLGVPFLKSLADRRPEVMEDVERELGRSTLALEKEPVLNLELFHRLPPGLCQGLLALPLRVNSEKGSTVVAVADPFDLHVPRELAFHFGTGIEVVRAPVASLLEQLEDPGSVRARAGRRRLGVPPKKPAAHPSGPPIPLVRLSAGRDSSPPSTLHGLAPPGHNGAEAAIAAAPAGDHSPGEPVLPLSRPKHASPNDGRAASEGASWNGASSVPAEEEEPADTLEALATALSAHEVVVALIRGLSRLAPQVVVLVNREHGFHGREASDGVPGAARVRSLHVAADAPSVLKTATTAGRYMGPLPKTETHRELAMLLGPEAREVLVEPVVVSGRPALVLLVAGFDNAYLVSRRAQLLTRASARALERIVRDRKQ